MFEAQDPTITKELNSQYLDNTLFYPKPCWESSTTFPPEVGQPEGPGEERGRETLDWTKVISWDLVIHTILNDNFIYFAISQVLAGLALFC